ncbi:MAG: FAD-dependent oxidoreductase [Lachnospiraceae bacterium]|nr:FAD-dependent oxidoreductase [Lachnospiraceae bacterium]
MKVLIIGSGISGLAAAIAAADMGDDVVLVSPYPSERAQSVMAAGGINASINTAGEDDSCARHAMDTIKGGCYLENEDDVRRFCENAPENIRWLEQMGVVFNRNEDGAISLRAFGGQSRKRTAYSGASTGKQIVTALVQKCREYEIDGRIQRKLGLYFYSGLIRDGVCYGALFCKQYTGELQAFYADAVIMATGGLNKLFGKTTGSELCDGYATGRLFSQGVKLRNLEFIQYHPTTIETDYKRMLITEGARGEGGRLYYLDGEKKVYFMEEKYGPNGNLMSRDIVSRCIYDCPSQVYLDISFLGEKLIHERLEEVYQLCKDYIRLDVTKEPIPVAPSIHFFMGGIRVDRNHRTNILRLYAVGECASKYHGANRLGGNSLMAAVYSGRVAAEAIHREEAAGVREEDFASYIEQEKAAIKRIKESRSLFPSIYIMRNMADVMNYNLGITRTRKGLLEGVEALDFYLNSVKSIKFDPTVSLYENYRIYYMLLLAKVIMRSAMEREETRGAHIREDFPETKESFRKCSVAELVDGQIQIYFEAESCEKGECMV